MVTKLSDEQWKPIDEWIFRGRKVAAIQAIIEATEVSLHEAMNIAKERRSLLLESRPGEFVSEEGLVSEGGFDEFKTEFFYT